VRKIKFMSLFLVFILFTVNFVVAAEGDDFLSGYECFEKLSDYEATDLLSGAKNGESEESFVFVFYKDTCGYSKKYIPQFCEYAEKNEIILYGLNRNDYRGWYGYSEFVRDNIITFPLVIAYNKETDTCVAGHTVHSVEHFHDMLINAGFDTQLDSDEKPTENNVQQTKELFSDVPENNPYFKAISYLTSLEIISGYEDNTFKPEATITRAETAAIIVRAGDLNTDYTRASIYEDVSNDFWGKKYIMAATRKGVLSGMGNGFFEPQSNVTHAQIIKILVCMQGDEEKATKQGGWPQGYIKVACDNGIITKNQFAKLQSTEHSNESATRGEVAEYVYKAMPFDDSLVLNVGGKDYFVGMPAAELSTPDEILASTYGFKWYVYGTDKYEDFFAAGIKDNEVVTLASAGEGFEYDGYRCGDIYDGEDTVTSYLCTDINDNNAVHGVFILNRSQKFDNVTGSEELAGESKMNFHFTNAFRVYHGKPAFKWNENAARAAQAHSEDMAENNYFSHDSMDGRKFSVRLTQEGILWKRCAENISAGRLLGFYAYDGWVNSSGHRTNMLGETKYLGVGAGFDKNSTYGCYFTQDFFS